MTRVTVLAGAAIAVILIGLTALNAGQRSGNGAAPLAPITKTAVPA